MKLVFDSEDYGIDDAPTTWEEVASLPMPQRIRAARYFLRVAACRLVNEAKLRPGDVYNMFEAIPGWISDQEHAWRNEKYRKAVQLELVIEEKPKVEEDLCPLCDGMLCPVCDALLKIESVIKSHMCIRCGTKFCGECHGVSEAQMSRVYDVCQRCGCKQEKS